MQNTMDLSSPSFLSQCFIDSLSLLPDRRRRAESSLSAAAEFPGFSLAVLRLISSPVANDQIRLSAADVDDIRLAAAVHFKNHLRSRWSSISSEEKEQIKSRIVPLLRSSAYSSLISESLSIIASHDFPQRWPTLLPQLVSSLEVNAADYSSVKGVLSAAASIFSKFRHSFRPPSLRTNLKHCLDAFAAPLLTTFQRTAALIAAGDHSADLFRSQRLCCEIFYSLNSVELPEFFEVHMEEWMVGFRVYLTTAYSVSVESDGTVDSLRAAICENLRLYMEKNEEEFRNYLEGFVLAVCNLLAATANNQLTITAIKFLKAVSTRVDHAVFGAGDLLQRICYNIVFPNIRLRDENEELFEMNYVEFIRRDIEGGDVDTRRRIACELLKGIALNFRDRVKELVSGEIKNLLANPEANWKDKECAIYLVVALAQLFDIGSFFTALIIPELQQGADHVNAAPMLKAGVLKFFTVFRKQIPKETAMALVPNLIGFLKASSNVVHSYAAICIEKLLPVKDRVSASDIDPFLPPLISNLFEALRFPESQENPYVMKCIMRVLSIGTLGGGGDVARACIERLVSKLDEVSRNPRSPTFNHYLFKAIAALIARSCEKDPQLITVFEMSLFPALQHILGNDITEFWPYAVRILALLVKVRPLSANAPALVRLLLGRFDMLISASTTEELGFYVLNTVTENLGYDMIAPYLVGAWTAVFTRLQRKRNAKFVNTFVITMSLFLVKHGSANLIDSINAVQPSIFVDILKQFWIPNLKLISGAIEAKLTAVASTRLICESPSLLDPAAVELWGKMLDSIITLLAQPDQNRMDVEGVQNVPETMRYSASFARLQNARKKEEKDPLKEIRDPKEFLVASLARLSAFSPRRYPFVIEQYVDPLNRAVLLQLLGTYNCTIV